MTFNRDKFKKACEGVGMEFTSKGNAFRCENEEEAVIDIHPLGEEQIATLKTSHGVAEVINPADVEAASAQENQDEGSLSVENSQSSISLHSTDSRVI